MRAVSTRPFVGSLAVVLVVLALSGCAASPRPEPTRSAPSSAPVFASDEEALAAAEKAYAAYLEVADLVFNEGGAKPERFRSVAVDQALDDSLVSADEFVMRDAHTAGRTAFEVYRLQSADYQSVRSLSITIYVCDDVSNVGLFDSSNDSLVSPDRQNVTPFTVTVVGDGSETLRVSSRAVWPSESFCT
ncbi:MAG: hypothetical protein ABWY36_01305 [Leifsonia sp.]